MQIPKQNNLSLSQLTKEMQLLLACAHARVEGARAEEIRQLAEGELDWDYLIKIAKLHGLMPLLYYNLKMTSPRSVPRDRLVDTMKFYLMNAGHNIRHTRELCRLLDLLEANGIAVIPFKGPALAQQIYGDITLRSFVDLDIIVHKEDVLRAKEVLISQDYQPEIALDSKQESAFLRSECEYNFNHKTSGIRLEVHWRINPSCYCIDFNVFDVWPRLRRMVIEGKSVLTFSPEDQLIALCIHGARHNWKEKKHICDVAALVENSKDLDLEKALSYAQKRHFERIVLLGLLLAERYLGAKLPSELSSRIAENAALQALVLQLHNNFEINSGGSSRLADEMNFWFRARERLRDRVSCIIRLAVEPTQMDLIRTPLPVELYPLYYLIHPVRLIEQYGINWRG